MFGQNSGIIQKIKPEDYALIFKAIMYFSKDGLFVSDQDGNVVVVNRASEEMQSFNASEILGRNVRDLVREGYYDRSVTLEVLKQKRAVSLIQTNRNKTKILSTGIPIFDDHGRIKFVLVNDRDITLLNRIIESLEEDKISENKYRFELSDLGMAITELQEFVITSPGMQEVIRETARAAKFDLAVVLTGESGVGKSMIAKLIHRLSGRRNGPFIKVSCGAIAESLLESELFGYEKYAFTGASPNGKMGLFEIAQNGTLFLDEISGIPLSLQVKLLEFLESNEIVRVGGIKPKKINTRVIAATNQDLKEMVNSGKFRSDLYFRLNVVPIHIPPLAQRNEEIAPLISLFLKRFNKEFKTNKIFSKAAMNALLEYQFPGNVRELENLIKWLVTMTKEDLITFKDLPNTLVGSIPSGINYTKERPQTYQHEIHKFEAEIIAKAIEKYGSQRKAARALGVNQSTLSRKLKREKSCCIIH
ncbi:MAG: sigma 54-interacting transcriptional regulator [Desulfobacteraceae bacterium]|nr:sigma 54-interacting transcriptional regulator [Desulfobacteraceae bacterium]